MPIVNDDTIPDEAILLRVLHDGWTCTRNGQRRPNSLAFLDGHSGEPSCFIQGDGVETQVRQMYPGHEIASFTARAVRESGYVIQRRPNECGSFGGDPNDHVVIGPPGAMGKNAKVRSARRIAEHQATAILPSPQP
jgi:hypothetical protein